jgi:hypothetical protein
LHRRNAIRSARDRASRRAQRLCLQLFILSLIKSAFTGGGEAVRPTVAEGRDRDRQLCDPRSRTASGADHADSMMRDSSGADPQRERGCCG